MQLTEEQLSEIVQNLDMGLRCVYLLKTGEIVAVPDFDYGDWSSLDPEDWQEELDKIKANKGKYFEFKGMTSSDRYHIMADFARTADNPRLRDRLEEALDKRKPFRHFRQVVDEIEDYRQKWFGYERQRLLELIMNQIE